MASLGGGVASLGKLLLFHRGYQQDLHVAHLPFPDDQPLRRENLWYPALQKAPLTGTRSQQSGHSVTGFLKSWLLLRLHSSMLCRSNLARSSTPLINVMDSLLAKS